MSKFTNYGLLRIYDYPPHLLRCLIWYLTVINTFHQAGETTSESMTTFDSLHVLLPNLPWTLLSGLYSPIKKKLKQLQLVDMDSSFWQSLVRQLSVNPLFQLKRHKIVQECWIEQLLWQCIISALPSCSLRINKQREFC